MRQREEMKGKDRGRARAHWIDGEGSNSPQFWNFSGEEFLCGSSTIPRRSKGRWRRMARGSYSCS
jgi:hypothetical protein